MIDTNLDTLSRDELEKRLMDYNNQATVLYRFDEDEQANEYANAAYQVYVAIQKKRGIAIHDPMTREDARRILEYRGE